MLEESAASSVKAQQQMPEPLKALTDEQVKLFTSKDFTDYIRFALTHHYYSQALLLYKLYQEKFPANNNVWNVKLIVAKVAELHEAATYEELEAATELIALLPTVRLSLNISHDDYKLAPYSPDQILAILHLPAVKHLTIERLNVTAQQDPLFIYQFWEAVGNINIPRVGLPPSEPNMPTTKSAITSLAISDITLDVNSAATMAVFFSGCSHLRRLEISFNSFTEPGTLFQLRNSVRGNKSLWHLKVKDINEHDEPKDDNDPCLGQLNALVDMIGNIQIGILEIQANLTPRQVKRLLDELKKHTHIKAIKLQLSVSPELEKEVSEFLKGHEEILAFELTSKPVKSGKTVRFSDQASESRADDSKFKAEIGGILAQHHKLARDLAAKYSPSRLEDFTKHVADYTKQGLLAYRAIFHHIVTAHYFHILDEDILPAHIAAFRQAIKQIDVTLVKSYDCYSQTVELGQLSLLEESKLLGAGNDASDTLLQ